MNERTRRVERYVDQGVIRLQVSTDIDQIEAIYQELKRDRDDAHTAIDLAARWDVPEVAEAVVSKVCDRFRKVYKP